jgi:hypothetical protein
MIRIVFGHRLPADDDGLGEDASQDLVVDATRGRSLYAVNECGLRARVHERVVAATGELHDQRGMLGADAGQRCQRQASRLARRSGTA